MKTVNIEQTDLNSCIEDAQSERVVVTRNGVPVALVVGVEDFDEEQLQYGGSDEFWKWITERRRQNTVSRVQLEQMASGDKAE